MFLYFCFLPLIVGVLLEFLLCRLTKEKGKWWRLLPPVIGIILTVVVIKYRLELWESEQSPVTQLLLVPGLPALFFFCGLLIGWRFYRWVWHPKIIRFYKEDR